MRLLRESNGQNGRVAVVAKGEDTIVCGKCVVADSPLVRLKGLLGRSELPAGEGILLRPASAIHTFFMRFPIDVLFLDKDFRVLSMRTGLRPWRAAACRGARAVLELHAGECDRLGATVGDRLRLEHD